MFYWHDDEPIFRVEEEYFCSSQHEEHRQGKKSLYGGDKSRKENRRSMKLQKKSTTQKRQASRLEKKSAHLQARKENKYKRIEQHQRRFQHPHRKHPKYNKRWREDDEWVHYTFDYYRDESTCFYEEASHGESYDQDARILPADDLGLEEGPMYERLLQILHGDDIRPEDYDVLLLLDSNNKKSTLGNEAIDQFPVLMITTPEGETSSEQGNKDSLLSTDDTGNPHCEICLEIWSQGTEVRRLPCGHVFCKTCIDHWLKDVSQKCPSLSCYWRKEESDNDE